MKANFERHIEALQSTGLHTAIYVLKGYGKYDRIDLKRLGRHFNMMLKRRHPDVTDYHFFWFRTNDGAGDTVTVCYSGSMFLIDAVEDFMNKAVQIRIAGAADEICSGRNRDIFNDVLTKRLQLFSPKPLQRSFGGAQLG
ncbi:hypothetical protein NPS33_21245 [Pseudomonas putida]|uniref:hypothetical protein n=1 Tax=Pseudomonas putida group TaxID=136845 RepID=UPI002363D17F|nr:hypothetical protein [Pseudomonas putida]MDD2017406.1 hypothetical protein [Pseudomonas putida]HDS1774028.1 hypothetical protein [Pseudomonas putida]